MAIAEKQAVASILAFSGVASAIFGVLLSRLEGAFEFSPTKFSATLKAARTVGIRDDLTLDERAQVIFACLTFGAIHRSNRQRVWSSLPLATSNPGKTMSV